MNSIKSINFHEPTPDIGTWRLIYLNFLNKIKLPIPYGFQFGPTYISTNDLNKYKEIKKIKSSL